MDFELLESESDWRKMMVGGKEHRTKEDILKTHGI